MATPRNGPLELGYSNDVLFWFRARLEKKVTTMMTDARVSGAFTPSQASKLYGTLNFLESGVFGRVGCGGLQPLKEHQYGRVTTVTPQLLRSFAVVDAVLAVRPRRQFSVRRRPVGRVLVASDAALEGPRNGSGGFLVLWSPAGLTSREAFVAVIPYAIYDFWQDDHKMLSWR